MAPYSTLHLATRAAIAATASANATAFNETAAAAFQASTPPPFDFSNVQFVNGTDAPRLGEVLLNKLSHPSMQMIHVFQIMGIYFFAFAILWNMPYIGRILDPLKLIVVTFHEFSHAVVGKCTGAKVESVEVTPDQGGATRLRGGNTCLVLPAGYVGSSIFGSIIVFCAFDPTASQIAAGIVTFTMLTTLWWARDNFTRGLTAFWFVVVIVAWVTNGGAALAAFILGVGTMSITYSFWDMVEDLIRRRVNHSDAAIFAKRYGCTPQFWGVFWFFISLLFLAFAVVMAMLVWP
ncbi:hypothetical protein AMAG_11234 [Allomyces macrogynus ATCC 38327]|uniref:Peptidase M50B-like-domain-containing protein n=1 Tax=Allomyces macrogynus (strain ATCC 38327) TaxID=578462 RepID=A0A0L0SW44_ALLM3|nr:hypothetical protein AMAG_11234 [Allomyces macrogynus ATCC 38327]|eukprot:KNE66737.1 hypothetical protein AMAG_11234 [Allomyces macrogynus ATCC 38327]